MSGHFDQPLIEYLSRPENLRTALQTARLMGSVQLHVRRSFMVEVEAMLRRELAGELEQGWRLFLQETAANDKRWPGVTLQPTVIASPRYVIRVEHEVNVYHGIWATPDPFTEAEIASARFRMAWEEVRRLEYTTHLRPHHWLGYCYPALTASDADGGILLLAEQRTEMLHLSVRHLAEDFRSHLATMVLELNRGHER